MASEALSPEAQVLYILSTLHRQKLLTRRERNLLKGILIRGDERILNVTSERRRGATVFSQVAKQMKKLAVDEAGARFAAVEDACEAGENHYWSQAMKQRSKLRASDQDLQQSLMSGEIEFAPFVAMLSELNLPQDAKFVDLGSGVGKAVLAAALLFDFAEIHGVELLEALVDASEARLAALRRLEDDMRELKEDEANVHLHQGDITEWDWTFADVVFANCTCFSDSLMLCIGNYAEFLAPGSLIITVTRQLKTPYLRLLKQSKQTLSWGEATFYVHQRFTNVSPGARPTLSPTPSMNRIVLEQATSFMSSPQGSALLDAKRRRALMEKAAAGGGSGGGGSSGGGGAGAGGSDAGQSSRRFSAGIDAEMTAGFRPTSPQGDALLRQKMRAQGKRAARGRRRSMGELASPTSAAQSSHSSSGSAAGFYA